MKSIIAEASSIAKAIEQSWKKTGKPQNFSVKILEEEEKNFLGMTKKPAKIAFFFEEISIPQRKKTDYKKQQTPQKKHQPKQQQAPKKTLKQNKIEPKKQLKTPEAPTAIRKTIRKSPWTDQMVTEAKNWTTGMLKEMNMSHINFSVKTNGNNLKFHFDAPLIEHKEKQKSLFRNFAFLIMQSTRYKFKKQFRNLKTVFTSN